MFAFECRDRRGEGVEHGLVAQLRLAALREPVDAGAECLKELRVVHFHSIDGERRSHAQKQRGQQGAARAAHMAQQRHADRLALCLQRRCIQRVESFVHAPDEVHAVVGIADVGVQLSEVRFVVGDEGVKPS